MSYVPLNVAVYSAAYAGALGGMGASNRTPNLPSASHALLSQTAGLFANAFDAVWGLAAANSFTLQAIQGAVYGIWESRNPQSVIPAVTLAQFVTECTALKPIIAAGATYLAGQGIVPGPIVTPVTWAGDLNGSTNLTQVVSALRGTPLDATAPTIAGQVLAFDGAKWAPGAAVSSRVTPPDADTTIRWTLDANAFPFVNSGTGAAADLVDGVGDARLQQTGLFTQCIGANGNAGVQTVNPCLVEPNANACTVSAWVWLNSNPAGGSQIFVKNYHTGAWAAPFSSLYLGTSDDQPGKWQMGIASSGVDNTHVIGDVWRLQFGTWNLMAFTYDGATIVPYLNGNLAHVSGGYGCVGGIDFGQHGLYALLGNPATAGYFDGFIDDVRVESIVRSQNYIRTMYKRGLNLAD